MAAGGPKRAGAVLATLILVAGVANLNLAVANVALPDIGQAFGAGQTMIDLIAVGYSLGLAASVLYLGAGIPVTPWDWSFDLDDEAASEMLAACPEGALLVLHSPPRGHCDSAGADGARAAKIEIGIVSAIPSSSRVLRP